MKKFEEAIQKMHGTYVKQLTCNPEKPGMRNKDILLIQKSAIKLHKLQFVSKKLKKLFLFLLQNFMNVTVGSNLLISFWL